MEAFRPYLTGCGERSGFLSDERHVSQQHGQTNLTVI
jgi:hypothetical protein